MRGADPHNLWAWVLGSVAQRYLYTDNLYMQQTQWKTTEKKNKLLRKIRITKIVFSDDINTINPNLIPYTSLMWQKLVRLGHQECTSTLAIIKQDDSKETVLNMAKKLQTYTGNIYCTICNPTCIKITTVENTSTKIRRQNKRKSPQSQKGDERKLSSISAIQIRSSNTKHKHPPDREKKYTPWTKL